ncbi:NAD-dependent epimerase/dehydratase family protein [Candidatus Omnitrophota bacterium]
MQFKTCLVTGGCGFIGTNIIRSLSGQIPKMRVIDDLSTGRYENIDGLGAEFIKGDIRDLNALEKAIKGVDMVIHLAAHTGVVSSVKDPRLDFETNAAATFNLLNLAKDNNIKKVIFASTGGAILGDVEPPVHEDMVPRPISPYGASKLAAESYCSAFSASYGLQTLALRFSNVYGPYSTHKSSVVAQFMKDILTGSAMTVYGDGKQTRDFLFVDDLVRAVFSAISYDGKAEVIQVASGRETSILELVDMIKGLCGLPDAQVIFKPARQGELKRNFSRIDKAKRLLGYEPSTDLKEGLAGTWEWFQSAMPSALRADRIKI